MQTNITWINEFWKRETVRVFYTKREFAFFKRNILFNDIFSVPSRSSMVVFVKHDNPAFLSSYLFLRQWNRCRIKKNIDKSTIAQRKGCECGSSKFLIIEKQLYITSNMPLQMSVNLKALSQTKLANISTEKCLKFIPIEVCFFDLYTYASFPAGCYLKETV